MDRRNPSSFSWVYSLVLILVTAPSFAVGLWLGNTEHGNILLAVAMLSVVLVLVTWPITRAINASKIAGIDTADETNRILNERLQELSILINMISENQLISDRAKAVAFREKDREAIRRAIYEEMQGNDYEAAMALANDIETHFGYKSEADRFRTEINRRWQDASRRAINDSVANIQKLMQQEQWPIAQQEAAKLREQYPNDQQVANLPQEIENRRLEFKNNLLRQWHEAVSRNDTEGGIDLLRQLDLYLSPQEAEELQGPARQIFKERLHALRTQFSLAVQDQKWTDAIRIGETIMAEYPNTRVSQELQQTMPTLRRRAGQTSEEEAIGA